MRFGKQSSISESAVQAVLDTLAFSATLKPETISLQHLFLVEINMLDPKVPNSDNQRLYTIQHILLDIITSQLEQLRIRFDLPTITYETLTDAKKSISTDSNIESIDLISWSILYYLT